MILLLLSLYMSNITLLMIQYGSLNTIIMIANQYPALKLLIKPTGPWHRCRTRYILSICSQAFDSWATCPAALSNNHRVVTLCGRSRLWARSVGVTVEWMSPPDLGILAVGEVYVIAEQVRVRGITCTHVITLPAPRTLIATPVISTWKEWNHACWCNIDPWITIQEKSVCIPYSVHACQNEFELMSPSYQIFNYLAVMLARQCGGTNLFLNYNSREVRYYHR
jgi:hypothetical protein